MIAKWNKVLPLITVFSHHYPDSNYVWVCARVAGEFELGGPFPEVLSPKLSNGHVN